MTLMIRLTLVSQLVLTAILGGLQYVDQQKIDQYRNPIAVNLLQLLFNYNFEIAITCSLTLGILTLYVNFSHPKKTSKQFRKSIMETILDELFEKNTRKDIRITIFKDAGIFKSLQIFIYSIAKQIVRYFKREGFEFPQLGKYIIVWEREAIEYPKSKTFFYFSSKTRKECQGIASIVRHDMTQVIVENLPDIDNVDLSTIDLRRKTNVSLKVKEYMNKSHIRDLDILKRLNRKARHFFGDIIFGNQGKPQAVLIVDSLNENSPFSDETKRKLPYYAKLLGSTFYK